LALAATEQVEEAADLDERRFVSLLIEGGLLRPGPVRHVRAVGVVQRRQDVLVGPPVVVDLRREGLDRVQVDREDGRRKGVLGCQRKIVRRGTGVRVAALGNEKRVGRGIEL
jgi:hypothetical protein